MVRFKIGWKAAYSGHDINDAFGLKPQTNIWHNGSSRNSAALMRALQTTSSVHGHPMLTTKSICRSQSAHNRCGACWRIRRDIWNHYKSPEKSKKFDEWMPHELSDNQKNRFLTVFLIHNKNDPFLHRIMMWRKVDTLQGAPQHFSKLKLHWYTVIVTVWGSTVGLIHRCFLNMYETITTEKYWSTVSKSTKSIRKFDIHLKNSTSAGFGGQKRVYRSSPDHTSQSVTLKVERTGYATLLHRPPSRNYFSSIPTPSLSEKCDQNDVINAFNEFMPAGFLNYTQPE